jgi:hypothetical protein
VATTQGRRNAWCEVRCGVLDTRHLGVANVLRNRLRMVAERSVAAFRCSG